MPAMNRNKIERERYANVAAMMARQYPDVSQQELDEIIEEEIEDQLWNEAADRAEDLAYGIEDSPCLQSCDFWGTGEGAYHGVI